MFKQGLMFGHNIQLSCNSIVNALAVPWEKMKTWYRGKMSLFELFLLSLNTNRWILDDNMVFYPIKTIHCAYIVCYFGLLTAFSLYIFIFWPRLSLSFSYVNLPRPGLFLLTIINVASVSRDCLFPKCSSFVH